MKSKLKSIDVIRQNLITHISTLHCFLLGTAAFLSHPTKHNWTLEESGSGEWMKESFSASAFANGWREVKMLHELMIRLWFRFHEPVSFYCCSHDVLMLLNFMALRFFGFLLKFRFGSNQRFLFNDFLISLLFVSLSFFPTSFRYDQPNSMSLHPRVRLWLLH